MAETKMSDIIRSALEGISEFAKCDISVGNIISTPSGVTVVPLSKVYIGTATGGVDLEARGGAKKDNFGGGGGTGVVVSPVAALAIGSDGSVSLINITDDSAEIDRFTSMLGRAPDIIAKIKNMLS